MDEVQSEVARARIPVAIGQRVEVKDDDDEEWETGVVSKIDPWGRPRVLAVRGGQRAHRAAHEHASVPGEVLDGWQRLRRRIGRGGREETRMARAADGGGATVAWRCQRRGRDHVGQRAQHERHQIFC